MASGILAYILMEKMLKFETFEKIKLVNMLFANECICANKLKQSFSIELVEETADSHLWTLMLAHVVFVTTIMYSQGVHFRQDTKLIFCVLDSLPCLLCLMCLKDTCTLEEKMLKDPRRLYAPGRLYHIVERKPFR